MTCEECNTLMDSKQPEEATNAEIAAVVKHSLECPACLARSRKRSRDFERRKPLEALVVDAAVQDLVAKVYRDPEAAEMIDSAREKFVAEHGTN